MHESAAFLLAEQPRGGMRDVERAHQMHLDDGLEGVDAHAVEDRVAQNAGVVDHAIELAEGIDRGFDDSAGGDGLGDGFEIGNRNAAALLDFLRDFLGRRRTRSRTVGGDAGIVDHDLGAFRRAEQRDLAPDAAARAGDDDDLVLQ